MRVLGIQAHRRQCQQGHQWRNRVVCDTRALHTLSDRRTLLATFGDKLLTNTNVENVKGKNTPIITSGEKCKYWGSRHTDSSANKDISAVISSYLMFVYCTRSVTGGYSLSGHLQR